MVFFEIACLSIATFCLILAVIFIRMTWKNIKEIERLRGVVSRRDR